MKQMDSLTERIYNEVLRDIRDGKIRPDEYIVEQDLCREFGISKGTAGDVLHRLAQDQIVLSYPRKGYKLNVYDEKEFRNIQTLRFSIESLVIHKLIQSGKGKQLDKAFADIDAMDNYTFHASLAAKTGDPFIIDALDRLVNKADHKKADADEPVRELGLGELTRLGRRGVGDERDRDQREDRAEQQKGRHEICDLRLPVDMDLGL